MIRNWIKILWLRISHMFFLFCLKNWAYKCTIHTTQCKYTFTKKVIHTNLEKSRDNLWGRLPNWFMRKCFLKWKRSFTVWTRRLLCNFGINLSFLFSYSVERKKKRDKCAESLLPTSSVPLKHYVSSTGRKSSMKLELICTFFSACQRR